MTFDIFQICSVIVRKTVQKKNILKVIKLNLVICKVNSKEVLNLKGVEVMLAA